MEGGIDLQKLLTVGEKNPDQEEGEKVEDKEEGEKVAESQPPPLKDFLAGRDYQYWEDALEGFNELKQFLSKRIMIMSQMAVGMSEAILPDKNILWIKAIDTMNSEDYWSILRRNWTVANNYVTNKRTIDEASNFPSDILVTMGMLSCHADGQCARIANTELATTSNNQIWAEVLSAENIRINPFAEQDFQGLVNVLEEMQQTTAATPDKRKKITFDEFKSIWMASGGRLRDQMKIAMVAKVMIRMDKGKVFSTDASGMERREKFKTALLAGNFDGSIVAKDWSTVAELEQLVTKMSSLLDISHKIETWKQKYTTYLLAFPDQSDVDQSIKARNMFSILVTDEMRRDISGVLFNEEDLGKFSLGGEIITVAQFQSAQLSAMKDFAQQRAKVKGDDLAMDKSIKFIPLAMAYNPVGDLSGNETAKIARCAMYKKYLTNPSSLDHNHQNQRLLIDKNSLNIMCAPYMDVNRLSSGIANKPLPPFLWEDKEGNHKLTLDVFEDECRKAATELLDTPEKLQKYWERRYGLLVRPHNQPTPLRDARPPDLTTPEGEEKRQEEITLLTKELFIKKMRTANLWQQTFADQKTTSLNPDRAYGFGVAGVWKESELLPSTVSSPRNCSQRPNLTWRTPRAKSYTIANARRDWGWDLASRVPIIGRWLSPNIDTNTAADQFEHKNMFTNGYDDYLMGFPGNSRQVTKEDAHRSLANQLNVPNQGAWDETVACCINSDGKYINCGRPWLKYAQLVDKHPDYGGIPSMAAELMDEKTQRETQIKLFKLFLVWSPDVVARLGDPHEHLFAYDGKGNEASKDSENTWRGVSAGPDSIDIIDRNKDLKWVALPTAVGIGQKSRLDLMKMLNGLQVDLPNVEESDSFLKVVLDNTALEYVVEMRSMLLGAIEAINRVSLGGAKPMSLADVVGMGHGNPTNFRSAANPGILIEGIEDPTTTLELKHDNHIDLIRDASGSVGWAALTEVQQNTRRGDLQNKRLRYNDEIKKQLTEKQVSRILDLASNLLSPVQVMDVNPPSPAERTAYKEWALADPSPLCLTPNQKCHFKVITNSQPPETIHGVQEELGDRRFFHTGFHDSIAKFQDDKSFNLFDGYKAIDALFNETSEDLCHLRNWNEDDAAKYMYLLLKFYFPKNLSDKAHSTYVKIIKQVLGQIVKERCELPRDQPAEMREARGSVQRMNYFKKLLNTELVSHGLRKYDWDDQLHKLFTTQIASYIKMNLYNDSPFPKKTEGSYFPKNMEDSSWRDSSRIYNFEIHGPARAAAADAAAAKAAADAAAAKAAADAAAAKAAADAAAAKAAADAAAAKAAADAAAAKAAADAAAAKAAEAKAAVVKAKEKKTQPKKKKSLWAPFFD